MTHKGKQWTKDFERALKALDQSYLQRVIEPCNTRLGNTSLVRYVDLEHRQVVTIVGRCLRGVELHLSPLNRHTGLINGRVYRHLRQLLLKEGIERVYVQPGMEES